jgi:hypothetical protein
MSVAVRGIIELNGTNQLSTEERIRTEVALSFSIVEIATKNRLGIKLGGNVSLSFMKKFKDLSEKILFELMDDPMDLNAECLFTGDGIEMYSSGIRIDTGESLSSRMTRMQNFLENLLMSKLIKKITLDINFIDMDEDTVEIIEIKADEFCKKMIELYQHKDNWTPVVRVVIKHDR